MSVLPNRVYIERVEGGFGWRRVQVVARDLGPSEEETIDESTGAFRTVKAANAAVLNMFPEDEVFEIIDTGEEQ